MKTTYGWMILAAALGAAGCDSGSSTTTDAGSIVIDVPRPDTGSSTDVATTTDTGTATDNGAAADTGTATDTGATTDTGTTLDAGAPADAPTVTDAATDAPGTWVDGCFVGRPVQMREFLNRCGGAVAFPARAARGSRLLADGGVQPLPM